MAETTRIEHLAHLIKLAQSRHGGADFIQPITSQTNLSDDLELPDIARWEIALLFLDVGETQSPQKLGRIDEIKTVGDLLALRVT